MAECDGIRGSWSAGVLRGVPGVSPSSPRGSENGGAPTRRARQTSWPSAGRERPSWANASGGRPVGATSPGCATPPRSWRASSARTDGSIWRSSRDGRRATSACWRRSGRDDCSTTRWRTFSGLRARDAATVSSSSSSISPRRSAGRYSRTSPRAASARVNTQRKKRLWRGTPWPWRGS